MTETECYVEKAKRKVVVLPGSHKNYTDVSGPNGSHFIESGDQDELIFESMLDELGPNNQKIDHHEYLQDPESHPI